MDFEEIVITELQQVMFGSAIIGACIGGLFGWMKGVSDGVLIGRGETKAGQGSPDSGAGNEGP